MKELKFIKKTKEFMEGHPISLNKRIELWFDNHLIDNIDEYKLATKDSLEKIDEKFKLYDDDTTQLEEWKIQTKKRLCDIDNRLGRLEYKYGLLKSEPGGTL